VAINLGAKFPAQQKKAEIFLFFASKNLTQTKKRMKNKHVILLFIFYFSFFSLMPFFNTFFPLFNQAKKLL